jgi:tellurite resistance protein TehA-like permease
LGLENIASLIKIKFGLILFLFIKVLLLLLLLLLLFHHRAFKETSLNLEVESELGFNEASPQKFSLSFPSPTLTTQHSSNPNRHHQVY